jgi:hypothetical protein
MNPILQMICAVLATGGVFTFIEFLIRRKDRKNNSTVKLEKDLKQIASNLNIVTKEVNELREDDLTLLHDRIYQAYRYASTQSMVLGKISLEERANIDYLSDRYQKRGGNHKANLMYEKIKKIPVEDIDDLSERNDRNG